MHTEKKKKMFLGTSMFIMNHLYLCHVLLSNSLRVGTKLS